MRARTAAFLAMVAATAGCTVVSTPELPLVRGSIAGRALVLVADASLPTEARATAKIALDAAIELARGDDVATGVLAATRAPASVSPQGGLAGAVGLAPLAVKTWREPPRAKLDLPAGTDLVLYRPAWTVELEKDSPPPIAFVGDPVPIGLAVSGPSAVG